MAVTTWDPANTEAGWTLSNFNLTATAGSIPGTTSRFSRGSTPHNTGKKYFEVVKGPQQHPINARGFVGIRNEFSTFVGDTGPSGTWGVAVDLTEEITSGVIVDLYLDGSFFSNFTLVITVTFFFPSIIVENQSGTSFDSGMTMVANFGASPFAFTPPTGYEAWNIDASFEAFWTALVGVREF
ncbi:MAG: hypothetical protein MN733_10330 [Nitrososphaera sp.]|nr:hypothetical protein [Nitrososphaera sp.]